MCRSLAAIGMTAGALAMAVPSTGHAQLAGDVHLNRLLALPVGALPPVAILMPASRNDNYFVGRVQGGRLTGSEGDRDAVGAGLDIQWRGGSVFGLTAGYQRCDVEAQCPSHMMYGGRANLNIVTGGPTFAALVGDASATTTLGTQFGFGYAPKALDDRNACAFDIGMPLSIAMFQKVRVVAFGSPGVAWDVRCPGHGGTQGVAASTYAQAGIGIQQLGARGLDVTFGAQQIFRRGAGIHLGISITYVRLP